MAVMDADSTWTPPVKGGRAAQWRTGLIEALEVERQRLTVWSPLLLVIGIWTYFRLPSEPSNFIAGPLLTIAVFLVVWPSTRVLLRVVAIVVLGFAAAHLHTQWISTPLLRAYSPAQTIIGYVADVDVRSRAKFSLIVEIVEAVGLPGTERPRRALVHISGKHAVPRIGELVKLQTDIGPLPRPSQPGGFDYGRQLYFQSIGAVGRSKLAPVVVSQSVPPRYLLRRSFHDLRTAIGTRVRSAIPGPLGSFADALITGERASIPRDMNGSLQVSGLFHILSISGLHMALVAGGAFWVVRAGLALFPSLSLRHPIKKWAACCAIIVGGLYMLLADSGSATERSFIMIAVVFFAVLVDRPALSMHNLAVAAIIILLTSPEQALSASFQMSFMAVLGLAAFFAWWRKIEPQHIEITKQSNVARWWRKLVNLTLASLGTSLVAGTLSSIPALHHFGRIAPYGVISNALALPIVSIVVMPMAMLSVLLMPLGLEVLPLKTMGWGLRVVMWVSDWVASWPAAGLQLPRLGSFAAALLAFTAAALLLPASRLRFLAIPLAAATIAMITFPGSSAILLVEERAGNVALITTNGLVPALPKGGEASMSRWMSEAGETIKLKQAQMKPGWTCSTTLCAARSANLTIIFALKQQNVFAPCPMADVLVSQEPLRKRCRGKRVTIDRFDVWRNGAFAVYGDGSISSSRQQQGARPWVYESRARIKR